MSEELVLVTPAARLRDLGYFTGLTTDVERYLPALLESQHLSFRPRSKMETDPTWLQLIPYVALEHDGQLFCYTRGQTGGEKRLHALKSVGIGGHINPVDNAEADFYRAGMLRELTEEIHIGSKYRERILGLVHDPSTPVGQVHLGVVHVLQLERPAVSPREGAISNSGFRPLEKLREDAASFETWSQFVLQAI